MTAPCPHPKNPPDQAVPAPAEAADMAATVGRGRAGPVRGVGPSPQASSRTGNALPRNPVARGAGRGRSARSAPQRAAAERRARAARHAAGAGSAGRPVSRLFGEVFLPLKRGIFQDLLAAHPEVLEREALKAGLAIHTRSTRYLQSVAAGLQRHDLQGQAGGRHGPRTCPPRAARSVSPPPGPRRGRPAAQAAPAHRAGHRGIAACRARNMPSACAAAMRPPTPCWTKPWPRSAARRRRDEALLRAFEASGQTLDGLCRHVRHGPARRRPHAGPGPPPPSGRGDLSGQEGGLYAIIKIAK